MEMDSGYILDPVAQPEGGYYRCHNALRKRPFPLAVGAIPGSNCNALEMLFGLVNICPLPSLPGMAEMVSEWERYLQYFLCHYPLVTLLP